MTNEDTPTRPVLHSAALPFEQWWRYVPVTLSADEHVALNRLARQERREKEDMAALLIVTALEERGLLARQEDPE